MMSRINRACITLTTLCCASLWSGAPPIGAQTAAEAKGKYTLVRVGDTPLPATVADKKGRWTVRDGWIEIYANGSWMFKVGITDPKGGKKTRGDFGNVSRAGDAFTFTSAVYGAHGATMSASTLEFSYDVVSDSEPEQLVFARPGQEAVASGAPASVAATPSGITTPAATAAPASPPAPAPTVAAPKAMSQATRVSSAQQPTDTASMSARAAREDMHSPRFELRGTYTDATPLRGATLEVGPDLSWQMHWTRPTSASGYGGVFFAADHGTLSKSGGRLTFRSAESGDFEARASGKGTLVVDYYLGETLRRWRFVKNNVAENPKNAPAPREAAPTAPSETKWIALSAGAYHACALATDGRAYCWGLSAFPEGSAGGSRPQPVAGGHAFASLTAGSPVQCDPNRPEQSCENNREYHVCAVTATGDGYCWGTNRYGQLGEGTTNDTAIPIRVGGNLSWESLSAGEGTTCGITVSHALYCWGRNSDGQLGLGKTDNASHSTPQPVAQDMRAVTVGSNYACAVRRDGAAYCWGNGGDDRLGTSAAIGYGANPSPLRVESNTSYVGISAGRTHVCAVTGAGAVECWGDNYYSESGPGDARRTARRPTPVGGGNLTRPEAGRGFHSCALGAQGAAYCWGLNDKGRLGIGEKSPEPCGYEGRQGCSSVPVAVDGKIQFKSLSAGLEFTCGISTGGNGYCWGDNQRGQLGTGNRKNYSVPTPVASP